MINGYRYELLVVFGGDGTFNEVINGLMRVLVKPKILYVPSGTVNDLGKYLSLPKNYKKAFRLLKGQTQTIDICKVNESYFSYVLACGKFTNVSYGNNSNKYKKMFGRLYYYFRGIKDFFSRKYLNLSFNNEENKKYILVLILNIWRVGNFKIRTKRINKLNDGCVNVVLFRNNAFFNVLAVFLFLCFGITLKGYVEIHKLENFNIKTLENHQFNTDGEESYNTNEINVSVIRNGIDLYISKNGISKYF